MISRKISWIETMAQSAKKANPGLMHLTLPEGSYSGAETEAALTVMKDSCHALLLDSAEDQMNRMLKVVASNPTIDQLVNGLTELQNRIDDQLSRRSFYQLRPEVAEMFESLDPFGQEVSLRFGNSVHDMREASRCFACERYDATVFHLMRVLEGALRQLASMLDIEYAINWDAYITAIQKVINNTTAKNEEERAKRKFVSKAASLLQSVQHAWRNPSMHFGSRYGPDQTRDILNSSRAFMQGFAEGLDELEMRKSS